MGIINRGTISDFGRRLDWVSYQEMRQPPTTGEGDPAQAKTTLDNWYAVQTRRRRRLKRGNLRNGGRDVRRSQGNNETHNRPTGGRQQRRTRQMGLSHVHQYGDTRKVYGDMQLPKDEHDTLRHVGGNANWIKPYPNDKGMISMSSNLRGLQAGSVSIIESNVEWQEYEWRENTYQTLRKTFVDACLEYSTSKTKFEGRYKPRGTVMP
jgi:hypothetical protein